MAAGEAAGAAAQTRSKVMLPVGNRPFMEHVILALAANDIRDLLVIVGYQKERVMNHFEDGIDFGVNITYIEQNELLGTAHALRKAEPYVDEEFLVVNGDNLIDSRAIKELISAKGDNVISRLRQQQTMGLDGGAAEGKSNNRSLGGPAENPQYGAYKFSPAIFEDLRTASRSAVLMGSPRPYRR
jgi:glucose-1-phosphate thymidylyltransferase